MLLDKAISSVAESRDLQSPGSCRDWASMCKHVAATLYGVGARLDEDPSLFFTLRGVATEDLVSRTVSSKAEDLLKKASKKSTRIIADADLSSVFGIDLVGETGSSPADVSAKEVLVDNPVRNVPTGKAGKSLAQKNAGVAQAPKPPKKSAAKKGAVKGKVKGAAKKKNRVKKKQ